MGRKSRLRSAGSDNSAVGRAREELSGWRPGPKGRSGAKWEFRVCIGLGAKRWVFHKQTLGGVAGLPDGDEAKHKGWPAWDAREGENVLSPTGWGGFTQTGW